MRSRGSLTPPLLLLLALTAACSGQLGEDTGDEVVEYDYGAVFDESFVHRLDLTMDPADWADMQADMVELYGEPGTSSGGPPGPGGGGPGGGGPGGFSDVDPLYVPVDATFDEDSLVSVGMRYKGNSTLSGLWGAGNRKLPFRLNLDYFEDTHEEATDQRLHGFEEISFSPNYHDDSQTREAFAVELFAAHDVPAARWAFTAVYVDVGDGPAYWGLYTMLEDPSDNPFRDRVFGDDDGNMYKPEGTYANWTGFDEASFEKKTNETDADWSDVEGAIDALLASQSDAAAWRQGLEATFDVDTFLTWLAVNTVMQNWDCYGAAPHNYYLYGDPRDDGRLAWVTWDHNEAMSDRQGPMGSDTDETPVQEIFHTSVGSDWPLIQRLLADEVYAATYEAAVVDVLSGPFAEDRAATRLQQLHDLAAPYVVGPDGEEAGSTTLTSDAAFDGAVTELTDHVRTRHELVDAALAAR